MQVRVNVDITKPLCRGQKLGLTNGDESWVSFKYERLPNLCYWCGRLTYHDKECSLWKKRKGTLKEGEQKFGSWLRVNTPNFSKKTIVRVEGYEEVGDDNTRHESSHKWTDAADHESLETVEDGGDHVEVQVGSKSSTIGLELISSMDCLITTRTEVLPSPIFQAQLDSINEDLARYDTVVEGRSFLKYHIDSFVHGGSNQAWRLTNFYGEPDTSLRSEGWNMLRMLSSKPQLPWCCFGDFNEILEVHDKWGGATRAHNMMRNFRDALDHCGFVDLGFSGPEFTCHGRHGGEMIWERLDGGVANYEWLDKFPTGRVKHLNCFTSDHQPILLSLDANGEHQKWHRKLFRFEAMWVSDSGCHEVITRAWDCTPDGTPMFATTSKLKRCKQSLKVWSRDHFGNVKNSIQKFCGCKMVIEIQNFFMARQPKRKRKNFIKGMHDGNGVWQEGAREEKKGFMAMKLDMSKAYDRVEWCFLEKILLKLAFQDSWVALIMECITTVSYSILVNGESKGMIKPSKGLHQGDLLSPYLFLFCVEGLNALLRQAVVGGDIQGFSLCRNGPKLTHLFFAYNCLIFYKSTLEECAKIQELLAVYEAVSGQMINREKTSLFFSKNTDEQAQEAIKVALNVPAIQHYEKYLELPSFVGRNKRACFMQIKERIWARMQAKQVWRLIHQKETLLFKVFSAKYFPNGCVLDAPIHPKCFYAWRSILQARDVINKGAIWRVGNGELIDIWGHRWLPDLTHGKIISPRANTSVARICELFVPNTKIWVLGKLALCFLPWEVEIVSQIQVCADGKENVLIWPLTADGGYSVRSAYHLLVVAEDYLVPSSSLLAHDRAV
ncbi:hypothetical protein SO802_028919 [Lithocarpus litseifolius]|uniref:Reverse transcriptase domain-containing protein n=1 Tax=Lithocarpus litseifolius TaxID=425828 RepID=A0AAW2BX97_9ROSI